MSDICNQYLSLLKEIDYRFDQWLEATRDISQGVVKMSKDTGYKNIERASAYNFLKWGQYMKRAQIAEQKLAVAVVMLERFIPDPKTIQWSRLEIEAKELVAQLKEQGEAGL